MKIVRDFRSEVTQDDSKVPLPPIPPPPPRKFKNSRFGLSVQSWDSKVPLPPKFKIADLDSVFKVRIPKYPPPPLKNSKIADLDSFWDFETDLVKYGLDGPAAETVPLSGYHLVIFCYTIVLLLPMSHLVKLSVLNIK